MDVCDVMLQLVNVETGLPVKVGEMGEYCMDGPQKMLGYLHNKEATDEMIDKDGWLHTGTLFCFLLHCLCSVSSLFCFLCHCSFSSSSVSVLFPPPLSLFCFLLPCCFLFFCLCSVSSVLFPPPLSLFCFISSVFSLSLFCFLLLCLCSVSSVSVLFSPPVSVLFSLSLFCFPLLHPVSWASLASYFSSR